MNNLIAAVWKIKSFERTVKIRFDRSNAPMNCATRGSSSHQLILVTNHVNASPTSIGSVVDERVAVTPMPSPSPSHRATATRVVHFAPTEESSNS